MILALTTMMLVFSPLALAAEATDQHENECTVDRLKPDVSFDPVCRDLAEEVGSDIVYCDMQEYAGLTFTNRQNVSVIGFRFGNANCNAGALLLRAVVRPRNARDVSNVVKYVSRSRNNTEEKGLELSVRSGGHSLTCNSIKPGSIHLDLRALDNVELIPNTVDAHPYENEKHLLRVGTGTTFQDIFSAVDDETYSFLHGECFSVGVGGFFLHGGIHAGIGSLKYGLGNETIRSLEMVTADGTIIKFTEPRTRIENKLYRRDPVQVLLLEAGNDNDGANTSASAIGYEELWDAVRIAGSSFGVVTELTIQTWREPKNPVWFLCIDLQRSELFKLLHDAVMDDSVQINYYERVGSMPSGVMIQVALTDGPLDPEENQEACLKWLDKWMEDQGIWRWRWTRKRNIWNKIMNMGLYLTRGVRTLDGKQDMGVLFLKQAYITSTGLLAWSHPQREELMECFHDQLMDFVSFSSDCYLNLYPLNYHHSSVGGHMLLMGYGCGPAKKHRARMQALEREMERKFPDVRKYVNSPIKMETREDEDMVLRRYFPNLDELKAQKARYDSTNIFSPYQGIPVEMIKPLEDKTSFNAALA